MMLIADQSTTTVFLILFTIPCAETLIFSCVPVAASWSFSLKAYAKCFSKNTFTAIGLNNSGASFPWKIGGEPC
jgi:ABC-type spermidine/putrescine transport system permease subunit II